LDTLATAKKHGHFDKAVADRRRAVLLTARAQEMEETNGAKALEFAAEAHNLAPDLIPAAVIAGRQHASRGATSKVAKVIERTWKLAQHPELALVYAYARPGDSPRDRLVRVRRLAGMASHSPEAQIALATAAIEAREWQEARQALEPLLEDDLSQRVCTLMARIEGEESNDAGRVREWLGSATDAPRDPAWTADGIVSDRWLPTSPATGALDVFQWKVPPEPTGESEAAVALKKIEELVLLGTRPSSAPQGREDPDRSASDSAPGSSSEIQPMAREAPPSGMRIRTTDSERPITVEVQPVTEPKAPPAAVATDSGIPLHARRATIGSGRESASDAVVVEAGEAAKPKP
jgi:HemY protein